MLTRYLTRWSWRMFNRLGFALTDADDAAAAHDPADDVVAGFRRFARCLERGLVLERPEGEQ